ncbi:MAG: hypothetical protein FWE69_05495 [Clostridiales bacterium]|nr:hypothetical protein [Clostridiales bacterium]
MMGKMTVRELGDKLNLTAFCLPNPDAEVTGGYVGDLLSWVMGRAGEGQAWITIMSNRNVAAVAQLTEVACVILAEGVQPDSDLLTAAEAHGINLLGSARDSFTLAVELGKRNKE